MSSIIKKTLERLPLGKILELSVEYSAMTDRSQVQEDFLTACNEIMAEKTVSEGVETVEVPKPKATKKAPTRRKTRKKSTKKAQKTFTVDEGKIVREITDNPRAKVALYSKGYICLNYAFLRTGEQVQEVIDALTEWKPVVEEAAVEKE